MNKNDKLEDVSIARNVFVTVQSYGRMDCQCTHTNAEDPWRIKLSKQLATFIRPHDIKVEER